MKLILETMHIENFKGCRELSIIFNATATDIHGMNGTGKTTIADAFTWVLFNRDSRGNAPGSDNFREKPLDENGQECHNLETTVELGCLLDGQRFDLKRTQAENWVKKRGGAEASFQGNVSTYWINGVETKYSDFKARIAAIADEDVFRLVGSLSAFNEMEWKKRRAQLLSLSGVDIDGELLARPEYRPIADETGQRNVTPDELRKILTDQRKRLNDELKMLPVRIDEAKKSLPNLTDQQIRDAEYIISDSRQDIARVDDAIAALKAGSSSAQDQRQRLALDEEIVSIKRTMWSELSSATGIARTEADSASEALRRATDALQQSRMYVDAYAAKADRATKRRDELRERYKAVRSKTFKGDTVCPTCGQQMPESMISKARERFDAMWRAELEDIKRQGQEAAQEAEQALADRDRQAGEIAELEKRVQEAQEARAAAMQKVKGMRVEPDFEANTHLQELLRQREGLEAGTDGENTELAVFEKRKRDLQAAIDRNAALLAQRDAGVEVEKRIAAHEARQREVGAQLTETERLIILLERFVTDRCSALETSINSHFPTLRWKLFDRQINGGIADCCECLIPCDGAMVSYSSANTASQINADVEIVNVLSEHYDIEVPLFVDNSERVNVLAHTNTQLITLSVSTDAELTVKNGVKCG